MRLLFLFQTDTVSYLVKYVTMYVGHTFEKQLFFVRFQYLNSSGKSKTQNDS